VVEVAENHIYNLSHSIFAITVSYMAVIVLMETVDKPIFCGITTARR
jgi:hypothetical protein